MPQSRKKSLIEVLAGTTTGFIGSWLIMYSVVKWGKFDPVTLATVVTGLCTVWSLVRGYCIRRIFNAM